MLTYNNLTKEEKIKLIMALRRERVQLLTNARKNTNKKRKKKKKLPNLQFKSPEAKAFLDNIDNNIRKSLLR